MKELTRKELIQLSSLLYRYHLEIEGDIEEIDGSPENEYNPTPMIKIINMIDNQLK